MKLWQELISTAIVGTDRQKFAPSVQTADDKLSPALQNLDTGENETALLKAAAIVGSFRCAGTKCLPDKQALPEKSNHETAAFISKQSEQLLTAMLAGNHKDVLPEFFTLAAQHKRVLPPQFLPEILDLGNAKRDLWLTLLPVLGERGRWLARHNPEWRWSLVEENPVAIWEKGNREERMFALQFLRRKNLASALEILTADWNGEAAKDRVTFLEILRTNLSEADETFLEDVLKNDKSSDVRRTAFELLTRLPGSRLVKDLSERAAEIIEFKKASILTGSSLTINLPVNFEKPEKSDVFSAVYFPFQDGKLGEKAALLAKLFSAVPPAFWKDKFSASPKEIIKAALKSDWAKAIFVGIGLAADRFADDEWLREILIMRFDKESELAKFAEKVFKRETPPNPFHSLVWGMPQNVSAETLENLFLQLQEKMFFAYQLLRVHNQPFSEDFSRRLVKIFKERKLPNYQEAFELARILKNFALYMPVNLSAEFEKDLSTEKEYIGQFENEFTEFLSLLQFRREIYDSFEQEK